MFESIPGQEQAKEFFTRALRADALSHAYLLTGPEGLAKTAFARELGVALVSSCGGCGLCPECERARRGAHPDLHVLEREGDLIRIDQIAPIVADLSLKPFAASRRVWIIPEVEYLHPAAANKLLKSIEEPPSYVFFLLVSDRPERVLPTIVSRCQLIEFHPLSDRQVATYLHEQYGLEGASAEALARLATGSVERAARLAEDARGAGRRMEFLKQVEALLAGVRGAQAADAQRAFLNVLEQQHLELKGIIETELETSLAALALQFQDARDLKWHQGRAKERAKREETRLRRLAALDAVDLLAAWLRDLWVVACGASDVLWNCDRADELAGAAVATPDYYVRLLAAVARTRKDLQLNIDQKLALQAMFARFEEVAESA